MSSNVTPVNWKMFVFLAALNTPCPEDLNCMPGRLMFSSPITFSFSSLPMLKTQWKKSFLHISQQHLQVAEFIREDNAVDGVLQFATKANSCEIVVLLE
jgi:hypothetical protein